MSFKCFVEGAPNAVSVSPVAAYAEIQKTEPEREKIRIMVLGSLEGVNQIVHLLHKLRFAEVQQWSQPLPTGRPGEVMRILTKSVVVGEG